MVLEQIRKLKHKLGPLWWHSLLMFGATRIGDVINLYISIFLVPAAIDPDRLGAILPLVQLAVFAGFPLTILLQTVLKFLNVLDVHGHPGQIKKLLHDLASVAAGVSVLIVVVLWFGREFVEARLKYESTAIIWLVIIMGVLGCWQGVVTTTAQALKRFNWLIGQGVVSSAIRLILILLVLKRFQVAGYLASFSVSSLAVVLALGFAVRHYLHPSVATSSYREHLHRISGYFLPVGLMFVMNQLQLVFEPWIVRHRLPAMDSAGFYMVMMFGNVPSYIGTAIMPFFFTLISERYEKGESTARMHAQALIFTLLVGAASAAAIGIAGRPLLAMRETWRTYVEYSPFIWQLGIAAALRSVVTLHTVHEAACRRFGFLRYYVPIVLVELVLLQCLMGWAFFKPWMPAGLWGFVEGLVHRDLQFVVGFMLATRTITVVCAMAEASKKWRRGA